jgi:hypothetical protein
MEKERKKGRVLRVFDYQNVSKMHSISKTRGRILEKQGLSAGFENRKMHFLIFRMVNDVTVLLRGVAVGDLFFRCNLSGFVNVILRTAQYAPVAAR